eukprot:scaffold237621_cov12-Tisochrysis_lutea.AAC.1
MQGEETIPNKRKRKSYASGVSPHVLIEEAIMGANTGITPPPQGLISGFDSVSRCAPGGTVRYRSMA